MHWFLNVNAFALIVNFLSFVSSASSDQQQYSQTQLENQCSSYCFNIFLRNTVNINNMIEDCHKRNVQMVELQNQLAVYKMKERMYEKKIDEKGDQCINYAQLNDDISSMKINIENIASQTRYESEQLKNMLKKLDDYRAAIDHKNEDILLLGSKLELREHLVEDLSYNLSSSPAALILLDSKQEIRAKVLESSCLKMVNTSEIWNIKVPGIEPFLVPCDGVIAGPGWTVIQRRVDDTVNFNRSWADYRDGFGELEGNLFIGLERIHRMTNSQPHELYIYLQNFNNEIRYARYSNFSIGSEDEAYRLKVLGGFTGDSGDALRFNLNMKFSTFDQDNDERDFDSCAVERQSGWWYNQCARSNLNGKYFERELDKWEGIWWWNWQETRTLKLVQMLIRPITRRRLSN